MKTLFIIAIVLTNTCLAQKGKWLQPFFVQANVNLAVKDEEGLGYNILMGRKITTYLNIGLGYSSNKFAQGQKIGTIESAIELTRTGKNRQLFVVLKPGINFLRNAKEDFNEANFYDYSKGINGLNLYLGTGIKWFVKRQAFMLTVGVQQSNYGIKALEYPTPINPYNPFIEEVIEHYYKYSHQKVMISLGIQL